MNAEYRSLSPIMDWPTHGWDRAVALGVPRRYRAGTHIVRVGDVVSHLYYLASGRVKVHRLDKDGLEITYWYTEPGNVVGEVPFLHGLPSTSFVTAVTESLVYEFSRECFLNSILPHYPELVLGIMRNLARKVRLLTNEAAELAFDDATTRVCKLLYRMASMRSSAPAPLIPLSHEEIAAIMGCHRVTVSRVLSSLKNTGLVSCRRGAIHIPNAQALARLARLAEQSPQPKALRAQRSRRYLTP